MIGLVQSPVKDLHTRRTSRSAAFAAISSSRESHLRSPHQGSIRPDFGMEPSLEMTLGKEDRPCFHC